MKLQNKMQKVLGKEKFIETVELMKSSITVATKFNL